VREVPLSLRKLLRFEQPEYARSLNHLMTLDVPGLAQARPKALDESLGRRTVAQEPDAVDLPRRLRPGDQRRGEEAKVWMNPRRSTGNPRLTARLGGSGGGTAKQVDLTPARRACGPPFLGVPSALALSMARWLQAGNSRHPQAAQWLLLGCLTVALSLLLYGVPLFPGRRGISFWRLNRRGRGVAEARASSSRGTLSLGKESSGV